MADQPQPVLNPRQVLEDSLAGVDFAAESFRVGGEPIRSDGSLNLEAVDFLAESVSIGDDAGPGVLGMAGQGLNNLAAGANAGIVNTLGAPADLTRVLINTVTPLNLPEQVGGAEWWRAGLERLGIGRHNTTNPGGFMGNLGEISSMAAGFTGLLSKVRGGVVAPDKVGSTIVKETPLNVGAATGLTIAQANDAGPGRQLASELFGTGVAGGLAGVTSIVVRNLASGFAPLVAPGQRRMANEFVAANTGRDPEFVQFDLAKKNLERGESGIQFPGGTTSGDPGLLALERRLLGTGTGQSPMEGQIDAALREDIMRMAGDGASADFVRAVRTHVDRLTKLAELSIEDAVDRAALELERLPPFASAQEAGMVIRKHLEEAYTAAKADEKRLWNEALDGRELNLHVIGETVEGVQNARKIGDPTIPEDVLSMIEELGPTNTIEEVQSVQSFLRERIRQIKAQANVGSTDLRQIGQLNIIRESILNAMGANVDSEALTNAMEWTKTLNDRFSRGGIGQALNTTAEGLESVVAEDTMSALINQRRQGKLNVDQMRSAFPGREDEVNDVITSYMSNLFRNQVIQDGEVSVRAAAQFFKNHGEEGTGVLTRFPQLKKQLEGAVETKKATDLTVDEATRSLRDIEHSRMQLYLNREGDPRFLNDVIGQADPMTTMGELIRVARTDESGAALRGLQRAYGEQLLNRVSTQTRNQWTNNPNFARATLKTIVDKNKRVIEELYGEDGVKVMQTVIDAQEMLHRSSDVVQVRAGSNTATALPEMVKNWLLMATSSVLGAKVGVMAAGGSSGQSILFAGRGAALARKLAGDNSLATINALIADIMADPHAVEMALKEVNESNVGDIGRFFAERAVRLGIVSSAALSQHMPVPEFLREDLPPIEEPQDGN